MHGYTVDPAALTAEHDMIGLRHDRVCDPVHAAWKEHDPATIGLYCRDRVVDSHQVIRDAVAGFWLLSRVLEA